MNYSETIEYLYNSYPLFQRIGVGAYKPGLGNIELLSQHYNHPHKLFKSIHIAGTNGKGSTSHMLAAIMQKSGYRTGLFTSPHLKDFRERIRINGEMIPQQEVINFVEHGKALFDSIKPSFFEITTIMAMNWFAKSNIDIAIIETGMGGRLDSTNIITPILSVITQIGLDHTEFLGENIQRIAVEKAGIIKENCPVVIGETQEETTQVFLDKVKETKSRIIFADQNSKILSSSQNLNSQTITIQSNNHIEDFTIDLPGLYQHKNILTVLSAVEVLKQQYSFNIPNNKLHQALSNTTKLNSLRGRWEILSKDPIIVCDTGHNPDGLKYVTQQLQQVECQNLHIVIGFVKDKDIDTALSFFPKNAIYYFTQPQVERKLPVEILFQKAQSHQLKGTTFSNVNDALNAAKQHASKNDFIFVGGSNYIVADIL